MIEEHFEETKRQLNLLADKIMLDKGDLEIDNRFFAPIRQSIENIGLADYLIDLANDRIQNLEVFINDESKIKDYKEQIIDYLRILVKERL